MAGRKENGDILYCFAQFVCHASQGPKFKKTFEPVTGRRGIFECAKKKSHEIGEKWPKESNYRAHSMFGFGTPRRSHRMPTVTRSGLNRSNFRLPPPLPYFLRMSERRPAIFHGIYELFLVSRPARRIYENLSSNVRVTSHSRGELNEIVQ